MTRWRDILLAAALVALLALALRFVWLREPPAPPCEREPEGGFVRRLLCR